MEASNSAQEAEVGSSVVLLAVAAWRVVKSSPMVECVGCRGLVRDVEGETHAYMRASPGCWQVYSGLVAVLAGDTSDEVGRWHHVDCYAVQHPGGAQDDRRQRQSVAVHLVSLCLLREFGQPPERASARRGQMSRRVLGRGGLRHWPYLVPPGDLGAVTAVDVRAAAPADRPGRSQDWAMSAWSAWSAHHDTVRPWAAAVLRSRL